MIRNTLTRSGGDKEDWDVFTHKGFTRHQGQPDTLDQLRDDCRAAAGSFEAYQRLQGNNPDGTRNPDYPHLLDIPNYIDYMIVNYWAGNWDWPWNNYWLARRRTPDSTGFKFYCWDTEDYFSVDLFDRMFFMNASCYIRIPFELSPDELQWANLALSLRLTELMYHPDAPRTEFVELANTGVESLSLNRVRFSQGIDFVFPSLTLEPGDTVLVVKDIEAFTQRYGPDLPVAGQFSGGLRNGGERITIEDAVGLTIPHFVYDDAWYPATDGQGLSLTVLDPPASADLSNPGAWRPSSEVGGSPGQASTF